MSKVIIKTVKRKTTISKAAISKAAKIAYCVNSTTGSTEVPKVSAKARKAA